MAQHITCYPLSGGSGINALLCITRVEYSFDEMSEARRHAII